MTPFSTESIRRHLILSGLILVLAAAVAFGLDSYGKSRRTDGVVAAGGLAAAELVSVKTETEAYGLWKARGYRGRIILFVADRWKKIDPNDYNIPVQHHPYPLPVYNLAKQRETEYLDNRNFLFMAALNGFARRIDAILSPEGFSEMAAQAATAINTAVGDGTVASSHNGFPRTINILDAYRPPAEPVIVFIGASIFDSIPPQPLIAALTQSRLTTDLIILCSEEGNRNISAPARAQVAVFAELLRHGNPSAPGFGRGQ